MSAEVSQSDKEVLVSKIFIGKISGPMAFCLPSDDECKLVKDFACIGRPVGRPVGRLVGRPSDQAACSALFWRSLKNIRTLPFRRVLG